VTFEVPSNDAGPWESPTVIYIDSIIISALSLGNTFDLSIAGFTQSSTQSVPGSTLTSSSALP
jgi:hypothetical protein